MARQKAVNDEHAGIRPPVQEQRGPLTKRSPLARVMGNEGAHCAPRMACGASVGRPLEPEVRERMELAHGFDFGRVRVHADEHAARSARAHGALAYAEGEHVYFGEGNYKPGTQQGDRLLAHKLAHTVQQAKAGTTVIQKQEDPKAAATPSWKDEATKAMDLAKNNKTKDDAKKIYKNLIIRASEKITLPPPLTYKKPSADDVRWEWDSSTGFAAYVDPKKVSAHPDDHWKWVTFNPGAISDDEPFTVSMLFHEFDHMAHARTLYEGWKALKKAKPWPDFYLDHYGAWTEKEVKVSDIGFLRDMAGLPKKIQPSGIEFRAYVNQFVNYFHKVPPDKQAFMASAIVLFYPLRVQSVKESVTDPELDFKKAKDRLLEYFRSPPVKDSAQKDLLKVRVASEIVPAMLYRQDDYGKLREELKEIYDYYKELDPDERKEAKKKYMPEML